ncbi:DNA polymerase III subunit delta [Buchnera aphidicola (Taiwanaphis decaspermi)]|uniref:DNA polymerase III subunit delta n=1 Tax=Buchnera aphidicola TaxID=9 RepID=UPI0031B8593A
MIQINHQDIYNIKYNKKKKLLYLITGDNKVIINETKLEIFKIAKSLGFDIIINIDINAKTNWDKLILLSQSQSLFNKKKIIHIKFNNNCKIIFFEKIKNLFFIKNKENFILLNIDKKNVNILNNIKKNNIKGILKINCNIPSKSNLSCWIKKKANNLNLKLDENVYKILCKYYEGNFFALYQIIKSLSFIYLNENITKKKIKCIIKSDSIYKPFEWVNSILLRKKNKSIKIAKKIYKENYNLFFLSKILYKDLFILLQMYKKDKPNYYTFFKKNNIWKNKQYIYNKALIKNNIEKVYKSISVLTKIEIIIKKNFINHSWLYLQRLTLILN